MFYRPVNELIIKTPRDVNNRSMGNYIHKEHKKNQWGKLNYIITGEQRKNDIVLSWQDKDSHTVSDVFNYVPMILNYLSLKGYSKILFVGHFNAAQTSWLFPRKSSRSIYPTPSYHSLHDTMVDPNIWLQFIPIVRMAYGYTDLQMHTLVPPESRHRKLMHAIYKRYEIDLIPCSQQYKHGRNIEIDVPPDTQYDAVLFAGVPKNTEDTSFSVHHIRSIFAPYCTSNFDILDMFYQNPDPAKYVESATQNNEEYLNEVFVTRTIWDDVFRSQSFEDRAIEYSILNNTIKCYKG